MPIRALLNAVAVHRAPAVWTWLLLIAVLLPVPVLAQPLGARIYPGELLRVIDGDSFVIRVDLGFDVAYLATIRLAELDTPERVTLEGRRAMAAADAFLRSGSITVQPTGRRSFARHVAKVYVDGVSVATHLAALGHRTPTP